MLSRIIRQLRRVFAPAFRHDNAQKYEFDSALSVIRNHFPEIFRQFEKARASGSLWQSANDQWFCGNEGLWTEFVAHSRDRKCLEIGSGPFGYLPPCYWLKDRVIIDPLVDQYRRAQLELLGSTFFTEEIVTYALPAEEMFSNLTGAIDGFVVCRNALDHCDDPLAILYNISRYAAPGCYLLLWTDIWHFGPLDEGHQNITRHAEVLDALLDGLGFEIIQKGCRIRDPHEFAEYGRLARKR